MTNGSFKTMNYVAKMMKVVLKRWVLYYTVTQYERADLGTETNATQRDNWYEISMIDSGSFVYTCQRLIDPER